MPDFTPRFELGVRNITAVVANIYAADRRIKGEMKRAVARTAEYVKAETYRRAAVDTGFMRDHIRVFLSSDKLTYQVGWSATDFIGAGLAFYPFFLEYGTRNMAPRPALIPAAKLGERRMRDEVTRAILGAIARSAIR